MIYFFNLSSKVVNCKIPTFFNGFYRKEDANQIWPWNYCFSLELCVSFLNMLCLFYVLLFFTSIRANSFNNFFFFFVYSNVS